MVDLPSARRTFVPKVPAEIQDEAIRKYLDTLREAIEEVHTKAFDNADRIRAVINTGTSGSFVDSDGNTVTVTTGLITALV